MNTRERMIALRLLEKVEKSPEYAKRIGVNATMNNVSNSRKEKEGVECA